MKVITKIHGSYKAIDPLSLKRFNNKGAGLVAICYIKDKTIAVQFADKLNNK